MSEFPIADEADVEEGKTKEIDFAGRPAMLTRVKGKVHAYINVCPHLGGPCEIQGSKFHCKWHGSEFDLETGRTLKEPAPLGGGLIKLPIYVKEGKVIYKYP